MFDEGFKSGLKYWLVFLLGFYFLGYSAPISIFLGGLAGLAGGFAATWWKLKEQPKSSDEVPGEGADNPLIRVRRRFGQWGRNNLQDQPRSGRSLLGLLGLGQRNRSYKSRR